MSASGSTHFYREFPYAADLPRSHDEHWARKMEPTQMSNLHDAGEIWIVSLRRLIRVRRSWASEEDGMRPGMSRGWRGKRRTTRKQRTTKGEKDGKFEGDAEESQIDER